MPSRAPAVISLGCKPVTTACFLLDSCWELRWTLQPQTRLPGAGRFHRRQADRQVIPTASWILERFAAGLAMPSTTGWFTGLAVSPGPTIDWSEHNSPECRR